MRRPVRPARVLRTTLSLVLALTVAAGCGSDDDGGSGSGDEGARKDDGDALVVYSGREKELVEPLYERFEEETDIDLDVRYAGSPELAAQMQEEGERTPADVFFAQDAGAIGAIEELLAPMPADVTGTVPAEYRDPDGTWVGVTGRVRTLVYNTDRVEESELPTSVMDVVKPEYRGRVGVAPTNASFIAFVSAMRLELGDERAMAWLEGLAANDAQVYEKNGPIVDATAKGEVDMGLVNHYYLYERLGDDAELPIANHFFAAGDMGNMVNTSAIGVIEGSDHAEQALELVRFMLDEGQRFIAEDAPEREYPLVAAAVTDSERYAELPPLASIDGPAIELSKLGAELEPTVEMIRESGLGA